MSMTTLQVEKSAKSAGRTLTVADAVDLLKPRISAMVLVTVALSVFVASAGHPPLGILLHCLLGTALVAASSGALNQWLERHTDALMERTADRPVPAGRLTTFEVLCFATVTLVAGIGYLSLAVRWQAAAWALATWVVYVCVYTPMKTQTSWNTTVGAISGAMPICIGWAAVDTPLSWSSASMFLVLFFWQFPHFLAIAWIYRQQYDQAGLKMVTTTDSSGRSAGRYAVLGALALVACSLLPLLEHPSLWYALAACGLGLYQFSTAWRFCVERSDVAAKKLLVSSILYLPLALGLIAVRTAL